MQKRYYLLLIALTLFQMHCASPVSRYRAEASVWEPAIEELEMRNRTETHPDDAVLFVGSSSIRLWETIEEDLPGYHPIQRGYGGAKWSDVAVFAERLIYPHRFQALVMFVANDISGSPDDKSPREVMRLFRYTLETVRRKYPDVPVFFVGITPTRSRWAAWPEIRLVNEMARELAERQDNLYYISTADAFLNANWQPREELFREDQLHLNREGYRVWAERIRTALDEVLKRA